MAETVVVEIKRPVNPAGMSFIKYVYGAIAAQRRDLIEKYRKELSKLVQKLGFAIEEKVGEGNLITGKVVLEVDEEGKPVKMYTEEIEIWKPAEKVGEKIEVTL